MTKRISLLSMALILAGFISATAQDDWWEPDTVYMFNAESEHAIGRNIYSYNSQGLPTKRVNQEWQNNTWIDRYQYICSYDANGNMLTSWENNTYVVNISQITISQSTYTYDDNNNRLTSLFQVWQNNTWVDRYQSIYTYDADSNMLTSVYRVRGNNTWENVSQSIYTYDDNNNNLTYLYQAWSDDTWENHSQTINSYDSNNNVLSMFSQVWKNNTWENAGDKVSYTYDDNNNNTRSLIQDWQDNTWKNRSQIIYSYDSNHNMLSAFSQDWQNNAWENVDKYTYTFDDNNNGLTCLSQKWQDNTWINCILNINSYDSNNNKISVSYQNRSNTNNTWINDSQFLCTYDENNNCTVAENYRWIDESWQSGNNMFFDIFYNNMQSHFSANSDFHKAITSYKKVSEPMGMEDFVLQAISIYPNPTSGELIITNEEQNIKQISIFDLSGIQLYDTKHASFDISHFSAGVYWVQIITEKGIVTKKIVKL